MRKCVWVALLVGLFASELASAQSFFAMRRTRSLIFVGGTGTATYLGELRNKGDYLSAKPNVNLGLQYYLSRKIAFRADVTWFQLSGEDSKADDGSRVHRNLSFNSNNFEISGVAVVNLYPQGRTFYQRPQFNLYGFAGFGLLYFNPTAELNGTKYALAPLKTEGVSYSRVAPVLPFGLGMRFKMGPFTNLSFEIGWRKTFTDYLDDVSTVYPDPASFADPIAAQLSNRYLPPQPQIPITGYQRGNPSTKDQYILMNVKLEYYLPVNFLQPDRGQKTFKSKRKAFYRYNKRGGLKRR